MVTSLGSVHLARFAAFVRDELLNVPLEQWGHYFPGSVAIWRFIHEARPDLLGELSAGFKRAPWFRGRGAEWFTSTLLTHPAVVEALDVLMRSVVPRVPASAWDRGFLVAREVPDLDPSLVNALLEAIVSAMPPESAV